MTQREVLLDLFRRNSGVLYTSDFVNTPALAAEYRRMISDLRRKGYRFEVKKSGGHLWRYRLLAGPGQPVTPGMWFEGQQARFA